MVPVTGLEPVRYCYREILSLLCLPFHHTGGYWQGLEYHTLPIPSTLFQKFFLLSSSRVTGPSLSSLTFMSAAKRPVSVGTPLSLARATKHS